MSLSVIPAGKDGLKWAQETVTENHYLHAPVDVRCRPLAYLVWLDKQIVGCLIFGRPQSTCCYTGKLTYGSQADVQSGRARFDRWEVLNMARVWLDPRIQKGGADYVHHAASTIIRQALDRVGYDYLMYALPVDCAFPYQIKVVLSYCDTRIHSGWIYMASRFKRARINDDGIETYIKLVPGLTSQQDAVICHRSEQNPRSRRIRASRLPQANQLAFA